MFFMDLVLCVQHVLGYITWNIVIPATPLGRKTRQRAGDPLCAVALQGLAIVITENVLGTLGSALPPSPAPDEGQRRAMH
jgi:hypothetical protein